MEHYFGQKCNMRNLDSFSYIEYEKGVKFKDGEGIISNELDLQNRSKYGFEGINSYFHKSAQHICETKIRANGNDVQICSYLQLADDIPGRCVPTTYVAYNDTVD